MSNYPPDWRVLPLGEVAEVVGGGTPSRDVPAFWENDHYWITPSEVVAKDGKTVDHSKERISNLGLQSSGAKLHPPGTILMTSRASIGFAVITKEKISTNQGFQSLRCGGELDNWFALHQIRHRRAELQQLAAGSTFLEVSGSNVRSFPFIVPPLPEQKKIAEILSGIDKTLERTKRRTTTLEALEIATRNKLFENLAKDSHSERKLSEIVLAPITYGIVQPGDYDPNGIILVRGQDYLQGWGKKEFFKVSPGLSDRYKRSLIKPKDVLICIAGANTGDSSITPKWISNANITQTTARVRADTNIISPEFLLEFTKSRVGRERLMNYVKGSAQPGLNLSDIEKVVIPIPGNDQQQRISNSMDSLKKLVLSSRKKEDYLNQIKKGLSSDLLSGRKRVSI